MVPTLGLSPKDFWELDLREFYILVESLIERREEEMKVMTWKLAQQIHAIYRSVSEKAPSVAVILRALRGEEEQSEDGLTPLQRRQQKWFDDHPDQVLRAANGG